MIVTKMSYIIFSKNHTLTNRQVDDNGFVFFFSDLALSVNYVKMLLIIIVILSIWLLMLFVM